MSFKVIDLRSGTKGVLHQRRHTGSKSREVLWYIFKYAGRELLATHRRIASATRYNSMGRRLPAALCKSYPELEKTKSSSECPALHLGYVWTRDCGKNTQSQVSHSTCSQIAKPSVQGREVEGEETALPVLPSD